ncbi:hypothetical protein F5141DRAFT_1132652, partial [Pisolithus sp. B1]
RGRIKTILRYLLISAVLVCFTPSSHPFQGNTRTMQRSRANDTGSIDRRHASESISAGCIAYIDHIRVHVSAQGPQTGQRGVPLPRDSDDLAIQG